MILYFPRSLQSLPRKLHQQRRTIHHAKTDQRKKPFLLNSSCYMQIALLAFLGKKRSTVDCRSLRVIYSLGFRFTLVTGTRRLRCLQQIYFHTPLKWGLFLLQHMQIYSCPSEVQAVSFLTSPTIWI